MDELIFILIYWGKRGAGEKQAFGTDTLLGRTGGGQGPAAQGRLLRSKMAILGQEAHLASLCEPLRLLL